MPLPAVIAAGAGIPAIAGGTLWQAGYTAAMWTWRTTLFIAFFGAVILLIGNLIGSIISWVYAMDTPIPAVVGQVFWWFLPDNTLTILFTVFAAKIARATYEIKVDVMNKHLQVYKPS